MSTSDSEIEALRQQIGDLMEQFGLADLQANELRALLTVLRLIARRVEVASAPRPLRVVEEGAVSTQQPTTKKGGRDERHK